MIIFKGKGSAGTGQIIKISFYLSLPNPLFHNFFKPCKHDSMFHLNFWLPEPVRAVKSGCSAWPESTRNRSSVMIKIVPLQVANFFIQIWKNKKVTLNLPERPFSIKYGGDAGIWTPDTADMSRMLWPPELHRLFKGWRPLFEIIPFERILPS